MHPGLRLKVMMTVVEAKEKVLEFLEGDIGFRIQKQAGNYFRFLIAPREERKPGSKNFANAWIYVAKDSGKVLWEDDFPEEEEKALLGKWRFVDEFVI